MNEIKPLRTAADELLSPEAFEAAIRAVGAERYHDKHVFHKASAWRQAEQRPGSGLGAEPLLLPGGRAAQGRRLHEPGA